MAVHLKAMQHVFWLGMHVVTTLLTGGGVVAALPRNLQKNWLGAFLIMSRERIVSLERGHVASTT
jgi:hypothetical protein